MPSIILKRNVPSHLVLALLLPVGLAACGSSSSAPSAATGTASGSSGALSSATAPVAAGVSSATTMAGTAAGTAGGAVATIGNQLAASGSSLPTPAGGIVTSTGDVVANAGNSLGNGAMDEPAGVTVLNSQATDVASSNLIQANVLSNTPIGNAPVQAGVAANGSIASAGVSNNPDVPVVSPLVAGIQPVINNATDSTSSNPITLASLASPAAGLTAVGTAAEQLGTISAASSALPAPLSTGTTQVGGLVSEVGAGLQTGGGTLGSGLNTVSGQLDSAAAPLNPLLDVAVGGDQLIGSSSGGALTANVDSNGQLIGANLTTPTGVPNPIDTVDTALNGSGSPLGALSSPLSSATSGTASGSAGLGGVTTTLGGLTSGSGTAGLAGTVNGLTGALK